MKRFEVSPPKPVSLTARVYSELRNGIITGQIPGGTRLVETDIASQMAVSRTPVREALHKLALEGLLFSIPRAGYFVEKMSDHDIQDLFRTRMAIEQLAAGWALEKITDTELKQLETNLAETDRVIETGATDRMMKLDAEFHHIIYKACRSKTLFQICQTLSDHTLKYRLSCIHIPDIAGRARQGHHDIYNAFRQGDAAVLNSAIQTHLQQVEEDIQNFMQQMRQDAFVNMDTAP